MLALYLETKTETNENVNNLGFRISNIYARLTYHLAAAGAASIMENIPADSPHILMMGETCVRPKPPLVHESATLHCLLTSLQRVAFMTPCGSIDCHRRVGVARFLFPPRLLSKIYSQYSTPVILAKTSLAIHIDK
jgi:hypothetical protein